MVEDSREIKEDAKEKKHKELEEEEEEEEEEEGAWVRHDIVRSVLSPMLWSCK